MYTVKQGGRVDYNYKEFYLDDISELDTILDTKEGKDACTGSIAFIISTSEVYCLNSKREWIKL